MKRNWLFHGIVLMVVAGLLGSCGFRRRKYENPITKETQQPDKVLFDKAIADVERGRYEIARLTLNTLMNTYDQSEYLAKAKLAIADSWFREGGSHGLGQAEAEYKDFILFYPTMEEAAEAQEKVCMIHFKQMQKADRDTTHALRAEEESRQLLTQFPNSKFAPQGQQILRNIQEVLAEGEFRVGTFYHTKGVFYSSANRLQGLTDHFPLFSRADEALWVLGDDYGRMGPRFRDRSADAYSRIAREYPLSDYASGAKQKLKEMEKPVPEPDPVALARQKYEIENRDKPGIMNHFWGVFRNGPDTWMAAKSGEPPMESMRPAIPATVPTQAPAGGSADVSATTITGASALDTQPDARTNPPTPADGTAASSSTTPAQDQAQPTAKKSKKDKKQTKKPAAKDNSAQSEKTQ